MRALPPILLCLAVMLTTAPAGAEAPVTAGLAQRAAADGTVRVMVQLKVPERDGQFESRLIRDVIEQLDVSHAQFQVASRLEASHQVKREFRRTPYMALEVSPRALAELAQSPEVAGVFEDTLSAPALDDSHGLVEADDTASDGYDGDGYYVAVLDTGVDTDHVAFTGANILEACFSGGNDCPDNSDEQTGAGSGADCDYSSDCDHGTHVAGIAVGRTQGQVTGIAPGADLIAIQVFSEFTGASCGSGPDPCALSFASDQVAALEHVLDLSDTYDIASVNMSLGGGKYNSQSACDAAAGARKTAIDNLREAGIATVIASGNNGYTNGVSAPGCISTAIAVGSTTKADAVSSFSNHGKLVDIMAPGSLIQAATPGDNFGSKSGTSMATPHVAGAFAVLKSYDSTLTVDESLNALLDSGLKVKKNGRSRKRIQLSQALDEFNKATIRSPNGGEALDAGDSHTIKWFPQTGAATYDLYYRKSSGSSWTLIDEDVAGTTYSWTVPTFTSNKTKVKVRVKAYDGSNNQVGETDNSDGNFRIDVVEVTAPNGGETFSGGASTNITWDTHDTESNVASVRLYYRKSSSSGWKLIEEINGNPETYSWSVPNFGSAKKSVKVRVDLRDANGKSLGKDNSDANFRINP